MKNTNEFFVLENGTLHLRGEQLTRTDAQKLVETLGNCAIYVGDYEGWIDKNRPRVALKSADHHRVAGGGGYYV